MINIIDTTSLYISVISYCNKEDKDNDNFELYKNTFDTWFQTILEETEATEYLAFDDERPSFRHLIFQSDFKTDRKRVVFKFIHDLRLYAQEKWNIRSAKGLESDDLCAIASKLYPEAIIAHIDGDLDQLHGRHYNYHYRSKNWTNGFYDITPEDATLSLYSTILKGGHNGAKGLMGCGDKCKDGYLSSADCKGVLAAYINGINKDDYDISKSIKGLGFSIGLDEFYKNALIARLLVSIDEANYFLNKVGFEEINKDLFIPIKIKMEEDEIQNW